MKGLWKKATALLLTATFAFFAGACASSRPSSGTEETGSPAAAGARTADPGSADQKELSRQEAVTVTMLLVTSGTNPDEMKKVSDKINEITVANLNTQVVFKEVSVADHMQKVTLMLAGGEALDLFQPFLSFVNFQSNGYLKPLDDYVDYIPDMIKDLGPYAEMSKINGVLYGLTSQKDLCAGYCIVFKKESLDKAGIDITNADFSYDRLYEVLVKLKQAFPDATPLMGGLNCGSPLEFPGDVFKGTYYDAVGDGYGVLMDPIDDPTLTNFYESDTYARQAQLAFKWSKEGLVGRDDLTTGADLVRAGRTFGYVYQFHPRTEVEASTDAGARMIAWPLLPADKVVAATQNYWSWSVSDYCEIPERALQLLNFMYLDRDIQNLLAWGVEGEHYQFADREKGVIRYPDGKDSSSVSYYQWTKFSFPNNFLQYVMEGTDPDIWKKVGEFNKNAQISLALGFTYDNTRVNTQAAACKNVIDEYNTALLSGLVDPDAELPKFLAKLKDAGIEDIITEKQSQLDAWLRIK